MNRNFYFTFGTDECYPFQGGWVVINAPNMGAARKIFNIYFPGSRSDVMNCAFVYTEEAFKDTKMYEKGDNLGAGCHMTIGPFNGDQTNKVACL